ncbi:MAG: methionyl-tRNA formyltransferase [Demequinaceae bacterium]|nr:methionyl-tRNA formyltransferase [Demequinaceae bacterium]
MRVLFAGTPEIALPTLDALLASGMDVAAVLTRPDATGRRGATLHPSPVRVHAESLGLRVLTPEKASDPAVVEEVGALECDGAAVVAYGQILKPPLLSAVRLGWVNLHFSLLPAWRGAAPVQRAIMSGDDVTGASAFLIEEDLDTGPILGSVTEVIDPRDTAGDLLARLARTGAPLMVDVLRSLMDGTASPMPQGSDGVGYAAKLTREDAEVRWDLPSHIVDRRVRGCTPAPGAWTTLPSGKPAKIGPVLPRPDLPGGVPGTLRLESGVMVVSTGTDPVELSWIAPAGKAAMDAAAWWRGARLSEGAQLGEA